MISAHRSLYCPFVPLLVTCVGIVAPARGAEADHLSGKWTGEITGAICQDILDFLVRNIGICGLGVLVQRVLGDGTHGFSPRERRQVNT